MAAVRRYILSLFSERPGERGELDGLRAWAILPVLMYHFWLTAQHGAPDLPQWLATGLLHSYSGVSLFFILSGYLITGLLLEEYRREQRIDLPRFWLNRALRILPALYVYLAITLAITYNGLLRLENAGLTDAPEYAALSQSVARWPLDFLLISNYKETFQPHVWSLCVEQHFYLLFPGIVWALRGHPRRLLFVSILLYLAPGLLRMTHALLGDADAFREAIYHRTQYRIDDLMIGVAIAALSRAVDLRLFLQRRVARAGLVTLSVVLLVSGHCFGADGNLSFQALRYNLINLGYGTLLLAALAPGAIQALLCWPLWRPLARLSYSMYLWHFFAGARALQEESERILMGESLSWEEIGAAFGRSVALTSAYALLSYYLIELPFLWLKRRRKAQTEADA